ncbi:MAG: adenosylcobinamide-GDP ribazoletransferase [Actinobacteria bacterium]|uniref:Adenosylcobinamide-GDP ribazoletransferase n=1 Tax=freshwater metagenome TaxID=449393 RepID=A0A6J7SEM2_9ZZZZ|nr:adenosylcobinamide-GDP ribazoletransferase [Actinomycetota bacterium]
MKLGSATEMSNALRLAIGTFTRVPVPPPDVINRLIGGQAMALAPCIAVVLALVCGVPLLGWQTQIPHALLATLSIAILAWITRGLHLDGLADVADGLGSNKPPEQALAIARKSDIGPFGVLTLVFTLLIQVFALTACLDHGNGYLAFIAAVFVSRIGLTWGCIQGWPAARADGLGAVVAETLPIAVPIIWTAPALIGSYFVFGALGMAAITAGIISALMLFVLCRKRFGGVTGDVFGAAIEISMTATLLVLLLAN